MNFIFISPNFPVRYFKWVESLRARGVNVIGVGDGPHWDLHPRLHKALTEYFFVKSLTDTDEVYAVCKEIEKKYGKIDYLESNNEWWLTLDAELRRRLNITTGLWPEDMLPIKSKSHMKEKFKEAGAKVMRYVLVNGPEDLEKAKSFISEVGYPVFVKPDIGVGAASSFKLEDEKSLESFLSRPLVETYIMEEYIEGTIVSFDGICDSESEVVFATSDHFQSAIASVVNDGTDYVYYNNPFELPFYDLDGERFLEVGKKVVKAFNIKKRCFHIEFFLLTEDRPGLAKKGEFVALECNMRAAGGYTPDLIDYANSISYYEIYADVITEDKNLQDMGKKKYYAFASARKDRIFYKRSQQEIMAKYHENICMMGRYPEHLALVMGDEYYYAKFERFEDGLAFDLFVREKA